MVNVLILLFIENINLNKMKKLQKIIHYILATVLVLIIAQFSVYAAGDTNNVSSLTVGQVIGGLAILLFVILVPLMTRAERRRTSDR